MLKASIDLGTNTCLLLAAEWDPKSRQIQRVLHDQSRIVRLGQGVDQAKALQKEAMERTQACLKEYAEIVKRFGISLEDTVAVATSQARDAKNSQQFFDKVAAQTGFRFRILSGEEEAKYTFLGALHSDM